MSESISRKNWWIRLGVCTLRQIFETEPVHLYQEYGHSKSRKYIGTVHKVVNSEYVDNLENKISEMAVALQKIEANFCACSIDDEIIPQVVAREVLVKFGYPISK